MIITVAAEGDVDVAAAVRLCEYAGHEVDRAFALHGKSFLDPRLDGYNNAARQSPWLVLRDLDHDAGCAPALVAQLLPTRSRLMLLRVPVRALETWLLADRVSFADFFQVREDLIPPDPETLSDPKRAVLNLLSHSGARAIRAAMLRPATASPVAGARYSDRLIEFITIHWQVAEAAGNAPSLRKCLNALAALDS